MTDSLSKTDKHRQYLHEHARLAELFTTDRFAFELERKRLIEENLKSLNCPKQQARAKELQKKWDRILQGAGSEHNRFVLMQMLFWDHIFDVFLPTLESLRQESVKDFAREIKPGHPSISLLKKPSHQEWENKIKGHYVSSNLDHATLKNCDANGEINKIANGLFFLIFSNQNFTCLLFSVTWRVKDSG